MGQDYSCPICGKHYQSCKHYIKEHIPTPNGDKAICGRKINIVLLIEDWEERDIDPYDICKICKREYEKIHGKKIPQEIEETLWTETI